MSQVSTVLEIQNISSLISLLSLCVNDSCEQRARKRLLVSVGVGESAAQIEAERELNETAHLSAEDQFTRYSIMPLHQ